MAGSLDLESGGGEVREIEVGDRRKGEIRGEVL